MKPKTVNLDNSYLWVTYVPALELRQSDPMAQNWELWSLGSSRGRSTAPVVSSLKHTRYFLYERYTAKHFTQLKNELKAFISLQIWHYSRLKNILKRTLSLL